MNEVRVRATRAGAWWALDVPDVPGAVTQVRRLDQAAPMVADAVALLLEVDPGDVEVSIDVQLPRAVQHDLDHARDARRRADELDREAAASYIAVARQLVDAGLTLREVGTVLGVSHQRAGQLVGTRASRRAGRDEGVRKQISEPPS